MAGSTHASPTAELAVPLEQRPRGRTPGFEMWRKFRRHRMAVASVVILAVLTSAVVFGPLAWRVPINEIDFTARLATPSWQHPFGTDDLGQDLLARMLYGGRISLAVGFAAMYLADAKDGVTGTRFAGGASHLAGSVQFDRDRAGDRAQSFAPAHDAGDGLFVHAILQ